MLVNQTVTTINLTDTENRNIEKELLELSAKGEIIEKKYPEDIFLRHQSMEQMDIIKQIRILRDFINDYESAFLQTAPNCANAALTFTNSNATRQQAIEGLNLGLEYYNQIIERGVYNTSKQQVLIAETRVVQLEKVKEIIENSSFLLFSSSPCSNSATHLSLLDMVVQD